MPAPAVAILVVALAAVAALASTRVALVALLLTTFVVPGTLQVPGIPVAFLNVGRIVAVAAAVGLLLKLRAGLLPPGVFRFGRLHAVLVALLAVAFFAGVVRAGSTVATNDALDIWAKYLDELLFFAVFVVALRVIDDPRWVARVVVAVVGLVAVIAAVERLTGGSWSHWWFHSTQTGSVGASPLEHRLGVTRVRAASSFALEFGWMMASLLPLVLAAAGWSRRRWTLVVPALVVAGIYWSGSRSPLAAVPVVILLVVIATGDDRRTAVLGLAAVLVGVGALAVAPGLLEPISRANQTGSVEVRGERLPILASAASEHPYLGLGFQGLRQVGLDVVDSSYGVTYAELGVVGLVVSALAWLTALVVAATALRAPPGTIERALAAGCVAGIAAALFGGGAYNYFRLPGSDRAFWFLAALAVVLAERPAARRRRPNAAPVTATVVARRAAVVGAALLAGIVVWAGAPRHAALDTIFETVPTERAAVSGSPQGFQGEVLVRTSCGAIGPTPGASVRCTVSETAGPGVGRLRVEAPTPAAAHEALAALTRRVRRVVPTFRPAPTGAVVGRRTWATTAPVWLPLLALGAALLVPPIPVRDLRRRVSIRAVPAAA